MFPPGRAEDHGHRRFFKTWPKKYQLIRWTRGLAYHRTIPARGRLGTVTPGCRRRSVAGCCGRCHGLRRPRHKEADVLGTPRVARSSRNVAGYRNDNKAILCGGVDGGSDVRAGGCKTKPPYDPCVLRQLRNSAGKITAAKCAHHQ